LICIASATRTIYKILFYVLKKITKIRKPSIHPILVTFLVLVAHFHGLLIKDFSAEQEGTTAPVLSPAKL
jgi:hypothetical protein